MFFIVANFSGTVLELADPAPMGSGYVAYVDTKVTWGQYFEATEAQFERLIPQLKDLENRGLISWDRAYDAYPPVADVRSRGALAWQPFLRTVSPSQISAAAAASLVITFDGALLLSNCVLAASAVGTGAGAVTYTAANVGSSFNTYKIIHNKPGPNTPLSAAIGSDFNSTVVTLGTNSSGAVTSTALQVANAVNAVLYMPQFVVAAVGTSGVAQPGVTVLKGGTGPLQGFGYVFNGYGGAPDLLNSTTLTFNLSGFFSPSDFTPGKSYVFALTLGYNIIYTFHIPVVA